MNVNTDSHKFKNLKKRKDIKNMQTDDYRNNCGCGETRSVENDYCDGYRNEHTETTRNRCGCRRGTGRERIGFFCCLNRLLGGDRDRNENRCCRERRENRCGCRKN